MFTLARCFRKFIFSTLPRYKAEKLPSIISQFVTCAEIIDSRAKFWTKERSPGQDPWVHDIAGFVYVWNRLARQAVRQYQLHLTLKQNNRDYADQFFLSHPMRVGGRLMLGLSCPDASTVWPHVWSTYPSVLETLSSFDAYRGDVSDVISWVTERREDVRRDMVRELVELVNFNS